MTHTYAFYVGSTDTHDAHAHPVPSGTPLAVATSFCGYVRHTWGIWQGKRERVAEYVGTLESDRDAMRVAHTLAVLTGNDAVLVVRGMSDALYVPAFRVRRETRYSGNRTLCGAGEAPMRTDPAGYAYIPDAHGDEIAFLVWANNSITAVEES